MKQEDIQTGKEYWSNRLQQRVTVVLVSGGYAHVRNEDNYSYAMPVTDLSPLDSDTLSTDEMEQLR